MFESKFISCLFGFILLLICVVQFSSLQRQNDLDDKLWAVQNRILDFGSKLNKILHSYNLEDRNILFSPMNIYTALLLLHRGSNATTRGELANILGISEPYEWPGVHEKFSKIFESLMDIEKEELPETDLRVNITNVIFIDRIKLVKKFVSFIQSQYDIRIVNVNFLSKGFEAIKIINEFISNRVGNRVPQLYAEPQTPYTKVILASCLNFKSLWVFPFRKSTTQQDTFYTTRGRITVNMMQRVGNMEYENIPNLGAEIGKLVTSNANISLYVVLPHENRSLRFFLDNLIPDDIEQMVSSVREKRFVDFKLPRTVFKWYRNLNETLARFGATEIFTRQADFSNMMKEKYFDVSEIKYVADVTILEHGIMTSSVTSVKVSSSSVIEPSSPSYELRNNEVIFFNYISQRFPALQFHVNRPFFIFLYHHEIKSVLLFGAVNNPNGA